ncbi:hypothetical protein SLS55_010174 [Diplodia seriata]|uniref:PD-(D/E)XK nuclease-like domain-containing protein n=1 Tax=Diplodia seriata TaxID=420778 RepID=A0ABR3BXS4_9PEZI
MLEDGFRAVTLSQLQDGELGGGAEELLVVLADVAQCNGVVPAMLRPYIDQFSHAIRLQFGDHNFAWEFGEQVSQFDARREFHDVMDIVRTSEEYEASAPNSDAAWTDAVHSRVLELALRDLPSVRWHDITAARISPPALIPRHSLGNDLETTKLVDYAIVLNPSAALQRTLPLALDRESAAAAAATDAPPQQQSINPTPYAPLRLDPICVSIATAPPHGDVSQARARLAAWGAAHLRRLDALRRACSEQAGGGRNAPALPTLPVLLVVGAAWDLYFVRMADDDATVVDVIGNQPVGDTKTLLGAYRLLCGLRGIAGWAAAMEAWLEETTGLVAG